ncbi:hypothetical protein AVEN_239542-1 [Araneus ventricosus]|uniref:Uncharacterized protein n=1 Tax=Araneus ventricosus TaxID=182803 RepID=A0A4Y2HMG0_ARAVE|nr:hypothetical protein AVEN_239542-1 [Araneus ventricosus]
MKSGSMGRSPLPRRGSSPGRKMDSEWLLDDDDFLDSHHEVLLPHRPEGPEINLKNVDDIILFMYLFKAVCLQTVGDRKDQTALARLTSGHLKTLRFSRGDKKFGICTKCNMIEATPQHLLDCVVLVYDELLKRPDFVLEVIKANDLMDLI